MTSLIVGFNYILVPLDANHKSRSVYGKGFTIGPLHPRIVARLLVARIERGKFNSRYNLNARSEATAHERRQEYRSRQFPGPRVQQ